MSGSVKIYTPISLILAIFIAIPFYDQWETALLYFFGGKSGVTEPVYGQDTSFYLLFYPIYMLIQQELLTTATLLFCMVGILYWLEHVLFLIRAGNSVGCQNPSGHINGICRFIRGLGVYAAALFAALYHNHEPVFLRPWIYRDSLPSAADLAGNYFLYGNCYFRRSVYFSEKHRIKTPFFYFASSLPLCLVAAQSSVDTRFDPEIHRRPQSCQNRKTVHATQY